MCLTVPFTNFQSALRGASSREWAFLGSPSLDGTSIILAKGPPRTKGMFGAALLFFLRLSDKLFSMRHPRTLAPVIDKVARAALGKDWNLYASLLEHWREIVGKDYAKSTTPVKIIFPKGKKEGEKWAHHKTNGSLTIRLPQGLAMEFDFISEQIKKRINDFFGYEAIHKIILETYYADKKSEDLPPPTLSPAQKEGLEKEVKNIENSALREVLQQLGQSIWTSGGKD
ncbi:MAG TPA: hypothetical protein DD400_05330 [Rhodospirillaceae bacterium]|nr:hypothetical protein [Rhodospirillaceae bacterium]